jgi:hypothetical protein
MRKKALIVAAVAVAVAVGFWALAIHTPPGPRSLRKLDPDRTAELETEMWQAYYKKEKLHLFRLLVTLVREQYRFTWAKSTAVAFHWARAAATFGDATGDYDRVLPDLERGYAIIAAWLDEHWDARELARAELAWWVARRDPSTSSAANVGRLIGELYAKLYQVPLERVLEAGVLRATAGKLRDDGGANADWAEVSRLLHASFRSLHAGVH